MKRYRMASVLNPSITKQPMKIIEIPLNKFTEEVIPHHQKMYEQYKIHAQKLISISNVEQLKREVKEKQRTVKQLKDLMYELDTLRTQVENCDLDVFDSKTLSLRKIILQLITSYQDLQKAAERCINAQLENERADKENQNPCEGASQIQLQGNLEDLKLKQHQDTLNNVEDINRDVEDLHEMYKHLNEMVETQGEHVDNIEEATTSTKANVDSGLKQIIKANKLNSMAYPITGALLGTVVGGPIGLVAGLKVGTITALGCAIVGYTSGKFVRKMKVPDNTENDAVSNNENNENQTVADTEKKDI